MIDFQALKQQLELLGHRLPDEQIKAILADMHVEVADSPDVHKGSYENQGHSSPPPMSAPPSTSRPPRRCLASELDESCPPTIGAAVNSGSIRGAPALEGEHHAPVAHHSRMRTSQHTVAHPQGHAQPPSPPELQPWSNSADTYPSPFEVAAPPTAAGGSRGYSRPAHMSAAAAAAPPLAPLPPGPPPPFALRTKGPSASTSTGAPDSHMHGPPQQQPPFLSPHTSNDAFLRACASPVSSSNAMPSQGLCGSSMPAATAATPMPAAADSAAGPLQPHLQLSHQHQHRIDSSSTSSLSGSGGGGIAGRVACRDGEPELRGMRVEAAAAAAAAAAAGHRHAAASIGQVDDKENQGVTYPANLSPLPTHSQPLSSNAYGNSKSGSSLPGGVHSPSATKDVKYGGAIGQMHEGGAWLGAQPPSAESGGCGGGSGGRGTMGGLRRGGSNICDSTFSGGLSKRDLPGHAFSASRAGAEKDEEEIEEEEGVDEEEDEEDVDEGVDEILAQYYGARAGAGRGALSSSGGVGRPGLAYVGSGGSDAQVSPANSQYDRWAGMVGGSRGSHGSGDMEVGGGGFRGLSNVAGQDVGPTNEVVHTKRGGAGGRCGREQGPQPPSASLLRAVADGAAPMRGHLHQAMKGTPPPRAYGGSSRLGQQQPSGSATKVRSPESVSGLSLSGRSSIARSSAGTLPGSARPGSAAKIDRVTRYKQLQQGWSKDKYVAAGSECWKRVQ